ncbi:MAG: hypothetical protein QOI31_3142 [Solirubrobacterales bacterium]|jgi:hypothetical protein|nr:hypothetical protein [Solirubrobacterales bacterium]
MTSRVTRLLIAALAVALMLPALAQAGWNLNGSGNGYAKATSIAAGTTPTASVSNRSVTVSWTATGGSVPVTGYIVKRYLAGGAEQTIGANCSGTVAGTSCTENTVPPGNWRYTVTPARQNWRGNESGQSTAVTVNSPALTLSPNTVTSLPQVLTGQITSFVAGQTVTFRLDNQTTGQVLTGSITPSTVPANGTANVSVTLPDGVANGSHTIFAIGSGSDVASANVTVNRPLTTITTSAFDWRDASAGGAAANASYGLAFPSDSRTLTTGNWTTSFAAGRYIDVDLNSPLRNAVNVSSGTINIRLATNTAVSGNGCFYVEARKASDNSLLTTYGSSGSPFCTSAANTQTNFSIPISGTTGALVNDTRFRIYGRTSLLAAGFVVDQVSLSLTTDDGNFTLYPKNSNDASSGAASGIVPFALALDDDVTVTNTTLANWQTTYATTRYMLATFPAYVPTGATNLSVTMTHVYRANAATRQVCNYVESFAGATSIGTHGSSGSDLSCSSSATADTTDTIPLPEVDTVAEANSLSARIYMKRSAAGTVQSRHDQVRLSITYAK